MKLSVRTETWDLRIPFRITGGEWVDIDCLVVEIEKDGHTGRGEAQGIFFLGETIDTMRNEVESVAPQIEQVLMDAMRDLLAAFER